MVDQGAPADGDSALSADLTYWGQFVDHDLTANTDRNTSVSIVDAPLEPMQPEKVRQDLVNLRQPQLNLDSVYGNGPSAVRTSRRGAIRRRRASKSASRWIGERWVDLPGVGPAARHYRRFCQGGARP